MDEHNSSHSQQSHSQYEQETLQQQPHYQPYQPYPPYRPVKQNGKAIASLVLGILGIILPYIGLIFGILGIIFAAISFKEIKQRGEGGRGLAIAGLTCGIVGTVLYTAIILLVVIIFAIATNDSYGGNYATF